VCMLHRLNSRVLPDNVHPTTDGSPAGWVAESRHIFVGVLVSRLRPPQAENPTYPRTYLDR